MKTKRTLFLAIAAVAAMVPLTRADELADTLSKVKVPPVMPFKVNSFPLQEVRLLDSPFKHAMDMDAQYILSLDVDRLLHNFRVNAGLPSTAKPLGGWEEPSGELRGHFVGHYLSAVAMMYASTGDRRFKEKGDALIAGLAECQAKLGSGYLSAYPESFIDRVEKRVNVWAPYYTLHKIFAGLEDMYVYCDNQQALEMAKKFGDWVIERNSKLTDEQMQAMMQTEHGGMNETLANLYGFTGEDKYLKISLRFNHHRVMDPLSRNEDRLTPLHANTQIPKFIGNARQFELTGDAVTKNAASFFWETVVHNRSYVIGGNSDGEAFKATNTMSEMGSSTTETCNTYNMLKLTRHLFCWDPKVEYADYYERALYNHILASQNPEDGMMCYYVPLRNGSRKSDTYSTPLDTFACCTGTGVENHGKYGDSIYFHTDKDLYVSLFIPSDLDWKEKGVKLHQENKFPDEGATKLVFACKNPVQLKLQIRHPSWAVNGFEVTVNGEKQKLDSEPGTWAVVDRTWKSGDTVQVTMPFSLHSEHFYDNPNRFALLNGPLVLASQVDRNKPFPAVIADEATLTASLKPVAGRPNTFSPSADSFRIPEESGSGVQLEPFYKIYGMRRYEVYWDRFTPEQWTEKQAEYRTKLAEQKAIEARTVDKVVTGEEQNERDHNLKGDKMDTRDFNDTLVRFADTNGWFSYDLTVHTNGVQCLVVQFVGGRGGGRGANSPSVDIWAGTNKLATEQFAGGRGGGPAGNTKSYYLGARMIRPGKITVKFQAPENARTPAVVSLRVMTPEPTIASTSKGSSTRTNYLYIVNAISDLREPLSSGENINTNPNAKAHFDWWPAHATNQWVQYDFAKPAKVSAVEVYWFDDSANRGGCRPPKSWQVLYRQDGEWKPVSNAAGYGVEKDKYNRATFDAVETDGLRLDVQMPDRESSGILQWKVEEAPH
jgi:uncharacterized protein